MIRNGQLVEGLRYGVLQVVEVRQYEVLQLVKGLRYGVV